MGLSINTNAGAIVAANAAERNAQREMDEAMIASFNWAKINSATDDPGCIASSYPYGG